MNGNRSVATIDAPEFLNLDVDAINPGISQCEIKVFYLGRNRNGSYIDRNTAIEMANSLPGTPIVGVFRKDKEDFGDHGNVIHIENGEIEFACNTIPYGFVAPDAEVWFQKFEDTDEFGNAVVRDYLMTTGYLWTGQYPEVKQCMSDGKGQSMELDEETLQGHWATDNNSGIDFFIINDAIFTKLCILGDDVEPCFEGASVTSPEVSKKFSRADFSRTLFNMMNELKDALQNKGGSYMPDDTLTDVAEETAEEVVEETAEETVEETPAADVEGEETESTDDVDTDFAADDEEEEEEEEEVEEDYSCSDDDEKKKKTQHSLDEAIEKINALNSELEELRAFKLSIETAEKDALIDKYFMLSDEDKADIVAHKTEYSLDEIEAKLAVLYVQKNVDFSTIDGQAETAVDEVEEEEDPISTFSLDDEATGFVPDYVAALRKAKEQRKF